jgi:hypothetical protein
LADIDKTRKKMANMHKTRKKTSSRAQHTEQAADKTTYQTLTSVMKQLGIAHSTLYQRMKYLNIKPWKLKQRSVLDPQQLADMKRLHEHIKRTGKKAGFSKQEPTQPVNEVESMAIVVAKASFQQQRAQQQQALPTEVVTPHQGKQGRDVVDKQEEYIAATEYVVVEESADDYAYTEVVIIPEVIETVYEDDTQTQYQWKEAYKSAEPKTVEPVADRERKTKNQRLPL